VEIELNQVVIQFAIIFLPGLIWAGLDSRYAAKGEASELRYLLKALLFGIASYAVTFAIYRLLGWTFILADLSASEITDILTADVVKQIASATAVGFLLAIVWLYVMNYKLDTRLLQWIGATKRYGDEDLWDFTFNSPVPAVEYVHFRDFEKKLVFAGWVREFSETEKMRELVLREAQIWDFDGNLMYEVPLLYLARSPENIHIEFPYKR
jgi:hypothetical protein